MEFKKILICSFTAVNFLFTSNFIYAGKFTHWVKKHFCCSCCDVEVSSSSSKENAKKFLKSVNINEKNYTEDLLKDNFLARTQW